MSWNAYEGPAKGILVNGDPTVAPTRWYNHWWLWLWGWKKVAVFEAKLANPVDPFFVGFRALDGTAQLSDEPHRPPMFRMLIGREDCFFFAVYADGTEIPLTYLRTQGRRDPQYGGAPLY